MNSIKSHIKTKLSLHLVIDFSLVDFLRNTFACVYVQCADLGVTFLLWKKYINYRRIAQKEIL